jgi:hydrogenase nickel incorporation protein HypA/HybF
LLLSLIKIGEFDEFVDMHELSVAMEIINIVEKEASTRNLERIEEIGLKIGALTGVDPEALRFAFEASTADTPLAGVRINIEDIPVRGVCRSCGKTIEVKEFVFICPHCGSGDLEINRGEELDIAYIVGQ